MAIPMIPSGTVVERGVSLRYTYQGRESHFATPLKDLPDLPGVMWETVDSDGQLEVIVLRFPPNSSVDIEYEDSKETVTAGAQGVVPIVTPGDIQEIRFTAPDSPVKKVYCRAQDGNCPGLRQVARNASTLPKEAVYEPE